jgi:hypothetical protein
MVSYFNSYFRLSVIQFKIVFIAWTVLSVLFSIILGVSSYRVFADLSTSDFEFKGFPYFTVNLALLTFMLPFSVILFYISIIRYVRILIIILKWLPIFIIPQFLFWVLSIKEYINEVYVVLIILFVASYLVVWIKQNNYFQNLSIAKNTTFV